MSAVAPRVASTVGAQASPSPAAGTDQMAAASAFAAKQKKFMTESIVKYANCPVLGGGSSTAYVAGGMTFEMPVILGAYARAIVITLDVNLLFGALGAGTYQLNAAAPLNLITNILVQLNNAQVQAHPFVVSVLNTMRGYSRAGYGQVLAGNSISALTSALYGSFPITANTTNEWKFKIRLPLNAVSDDSPWGLLPLSGVGAQAQITLTGNPQIFGTDAFNSAVSQTSGTDGAVSIAASSTVICDIEYLDGTSLFTTDTLTLDIFSEPTVQWVVDNQLNNIVSGSLQRSRIATLQENYYLISIIIDGQLSTKFCADTNITILQLAQDQQGQNVFWTFGSYTNVSMYDYFGFLRWVFGQDFPEGVIPFVGAPSFGVNDPSNRSGKQVLNMTDSGWPAATVAAQLGTVASTTGTPRILNYVVAKNNAGLLKK